MEDAVDHLVSEADEGRPGFISTYSFPRGHSKKRRIPKVDTIFVDFDIQGDQYKPDEGLDSEMYWEIEMSDLLVRIRAFAQRLVDEGEAKYWRASLSGHKGVHLFLDFPAIDPANGSFIQFKTGLRDYADTMMESLDEMLGGIHLTDWVDVVSADLGRLLRQPNTPHTGVAYTDELKYCVPVSVEELAEIKVDDYKRLTDAPRSPPPASHRTESESAGQKVSQAIRTAKSGGRGDLQQPASSYNSARIDEYREKANDKIEVEDLKLLYSDKPFVWKFRERDDAYEYGTQSRTMEMFIMLDFIYDTNAPVDVIVDFFRPIPGFDETYTREMVKDLIARDYKPMSISTLRDKAPEFYDGSDIYT